MNKVKKSSEPVMRVIYMIKADENNVFHQ